MMTTHQFEIQVGQQLEWLTEVEEIIKKNQVQAPFFSRRIIYSRSGVRKESPSLQAHLDQDEITETLLTEISVAYLVIQHKKEILEGTFDFNHVIKESFNAEFIKMQSSCIFDTMLHPQCPEISQVPPMKKYQIESSGGFFTNFEAVIDNIKIRGNLEKEI